MTMLTPTHTTGHKCETAPKLRTTHTGLGIFTEFYLTSAEPGGWLIVVHKGAHVGQANLTIAL